VRWLRKEWANVLRVRNNGVPLVGFTWYSLIDQVDWDTALREDNGHANALGLFDLNRHIRAVGVAYRELVRAWMEVLPTKSVCLQIPIVMPYEYDMECNQDELSARIAKQKEWGAIDDAASR
jgi:hypothetical protein